MMLTQNSNYCLFFVNQIHKTFKKQEIKVNSLFLLSMPKGLAKPRNEAAQALEILNYCHLTPALLQASQKALLCLFEAKSQF